MKRYKLYTLMLSILLILLAVIQSTVQSEKEANLTVYMPILTKPESRYWARTYGQVGTISRMIPTDDGGSLLVGSTLNDLRWVMRINWDGSVAWRKLFVLANQIDVAPTAEGGFVIVGTEPVIQYPETDAYVIQLNPDGTTDWVKLYDGTASPTGYSVYSAEAIAAATDGGYAVAGASGNVSGPGEVNAWVFKVSATGEIVWQTALGGVGQFDVAFATLIRQTHDSGYIVSGVPPTGKKAWLFKLDNNGNVEWQMIYDALPNFPTTEIHDILETESGDFLVVAGRRSLVQADAWVALIDNNGNLIWQKSFGFPAYFSSVTATLDGNYVLSGYFEGDGWLHKMDANGTTIWDRRYGGEWADELSQVYAHADGSLVASGVTCSFEIDCGLWVLSLDSNGEIRNCSFITEENVTPVNWPSVAQMATFTSEAVTASAANYYAGAMDEGVVPLLLCTVDGGTSAAACQP